MIDAFARLADPDVRLIIFGEGALRTELFEQAVALGVADRFDLPGYTSDPLAEVAAADCFVLSSRFEGSPNALVEAMSTGTPVVSTHCPYGPQEILDNGAIAPLVAVDDPDALAQAITVELTLPRDANRQARIDAAARFISARAAKKPISMHWQGCRHEQTGSQVHHPARRFHVVRRAVLHPGHRIFFGLADVSNLGAAEKKTSKATWSTRSAA
ncbi:glycosyltransferase [Pseudomonas lini]